jgi:hypothetical protein
LLGYLLLLWSVVLVLFLPNGWATIWVASAATLLLAFDRRLGPLPAALLVMLALPVGRGSEVGLPHLAGIPVRVHDILPIIGVLLSLPAMSQRLRHPRDIDWMAVVPMIGFAVVGLTALALGLLGDAAARDITRDARWWGFYLIGILAVLTATRFSSVMRGVLWGLSLYVLILLIGLLMPVFHGGLKWYAYVYDPRMRLHYGQAIFLLVGVAYVAARATRRPSAPAFALIALFSAGVAVTLTRTLLVGAVATAWLVAIWVAVGLLPRAKRQSPSLIGRSLLRHGLPVVLAVLVGIAGGFGSYLGGLQIWHPVGTPAVGGRGSTRISEDRPIRPVLNRVFADTESTGIAAQTYGRLPSYAAAFVDTADAPLLGHGLGRLADVGWAWGGFRSHTAGAQPGVDNAYLTVGIKAGAVGIAAFGAMLLWPLLLLWHRRPARRLRAWYVPAWVAILGLTLLQSFAVSGYAPFVLGMLLVLPALGWSTRRSPAH